MLYLLLRRLFRLTRVFARIKVKLFHKSKGLLRSYSIKKKYIMNSSKVLHIVEMSKNMPFRAITRTISWIRQNCRSVQVRVLPCGLGAIYKKVHVQKKHVQDLYRCQMPAAEVISACYKIFLSRREILSFLLLIVQVLTAAAAITTTAVAVALQPQPNFQPINNISICRAVVVSSCLTH